MIIRDLCGNEHIINGCLGCEISSGRLNPIGGILYKDEYFSVSQDFELPINGFIIISSIKHFENLNELSDVERTILIQLINRIIELLKSYNIADSFNVILEEKKGYHFHVWIMPRNNWMIEKFGKVLKNIKLIQDYAKENLRNDDNIENILNTCKKLKSDLKKNKG